MRNGETNARRTRVKFGDVVRLSIERCQDPLMEGLERYVGLEHIEPSDLRVRTWGRIAEGTTFTSRFRPGQVLFGKRRAYQRKVAVADFDGVCSGDIYVLEAKNGALLPELLPFLCQTESFFEHAVGTSAGSLSPRTKWRSLAEFEFALPPLEEQRTILSRCQSLEALIQADHELRPAIRKALDAVDQWYATGEGGRLDSTGQVVDEDLPRGWGRHSIREVCTGEGGGLTLGPFGSDLTIKDYGHLSEGTPVLFVADVQRFKLRHESRKFIGRRKHDELGAHEALPGDVLITEMGWPPGEACVVPSGWPPSIIKADILRCRLNRALVWPEYLCAILNSHWGQQQMVRISPGTTRPRMTLRDFERLQLVLPPVSSQLEVIGLITASLQRIEEVELRIRGMQGLKARLLAEELEGA